MIGKAEKLQENMVKLVKGGLCVAFSGGVDSTLLLQFAQEAAQAEQEPLWAVLFATQLHPPADRAEAEKLAADIGAPLEVIEVDELSSPEILRNPATTANACFFRCSKSSPQKKGPPMWPTAPIMTIFSNTVPA